MSCIIVKAYKFRQNCTISTIQGLSFEEKEQICLWCKSEECRNGLMDGKFEPITNDWSIEITAEPQLFLLDSLGYHILTPTSYPITLNGSTDGHEIIWTLIKKSKIKEKGRKKEATIGTDDHKCASCGKSFSQAWILRNRVDAVLYGQ